MTLDSSTLLTFYCLMLWFKRQTLFIFSLGISWMNNSDHVFVYGDKRWKVTCLAVRRPQRACTDQGQAADASAVVCTSYGTNLPALWAKQSRYVCRGFLSTHIHLSPSQNVLPVLAVRRWVDFVPVAQLPLPTVVHCRNGTSGTPGETGLQGTTN